MSAWVPIEPTRVPRIYLTESTALAHRGEMYRPPRRIRFWRFSRLYRPIASFCRNRGAHGCRERHEGHRKRQPEAESGPAASGKCFERRCLLWDLTAAIRGSVSFSRMLASLTTSLECFDAVSGLANGAVSAQSSCLGEPYGQPLPPNFGVPKTLPRTYSSLHL